MNKDNRMGHPLFTHSMQLSDMLDANSSLLQVFQRFGLQMKYLARPVNEACRLSGIDSGIFVLICNVYTFDGYVPGEKELESGNVEDILKYLRNSHSFYTGIALKNLANLLYRLIAPCDKARKTIILKFFTDYKKELLKHFRYEEKVVFPYAEALISGCGTGEYNIEEFERHHEDVEEKLGDLKNIVMKYLPEECEDATRVSVLLGIYRLQEDLSRHTYVENSVFVPVVRRMEIHGK